MYSGHCNKVCEGESEDDVPGVSDFVSLVPSIRPDTADTIVAALGDNFSAEFGIVSVSGASASSSCSSLTVGSEVFVFVKKVADNCLVFAADAKEDFRECLVT